MVQFPGSTIQITTASTGTITTSNGSINLNATNGIVFSNAFTFNSGGGAINFNNAVTLGAATAVNSSNGAVTFANTVDGTNNLTVNSGTGLTSFSGKIGNVTPLNNLSLTADSVSFGGNIFGTGTLTLAPSTLNTAMHITDGTSTGWYLNSTELGYIQSDWSGVTLGATSDTGATTMGAYSSWANPVGFLTGSSGSITESGAQTAIGSGSFSFTGPTTLDANLTTSNQAITFNSAVTLGGNSTVNSGTGTITAAAIATGSNNLALEGDTLSLSGNLTGTGSLTLEPYTTTKTINVAGTASQWNLSTTTLNYIQSGFKGITIGSPTDTGLLTANAYTWNAPVSLLGGTGGIAINGAQTIGTGQ